LLDGEYVLTPDSLAEHWSTFAHLILPETYLMEIGEIKTRHREAMKHIVEGDRFLEEDKDNQSVIEKAIEKYELTYEVEAEIARSLVERHAESNWKAIACLSAASLAWRCGKTDLAKTHIYAGLKDVKSYVTKDALHQLLEDVENDVKFFSKN